MQNNCFPFFNNNKDVADQNKLSQLIRLAAIVCGQNQELEYYVTWN